MPKLTVDSRPREEVKFIAGVRSTQMENPAIPTGDHRHISHVREGRQSAEVWSRAQRAEWHEEFEGEYPKGFRATLKEVVKNADQELSQRGAKGVPADAKNLRGKEGSKRVLRSGKQAGEGKEHERESEKRIQKAKARKRTAQKKVSK